MVVADHAEYEPNKETNDNAMVYKTRGMEAESIFLSSQKCATGEGKLDRSCFLDFTHLCLAEFVMSTRGEQGCIL